MKCYNYLRSVLLLVALAWCSLLPAQPPAPLRTVESFLYVGDYEVRHELLVPLRALESLVPVQHDNPSTLTVAEQDAIRPTALTLLDSMNPVSIDGIPVTAVDGTVVFFDLEVANIVGEIPKVDLPSANAVAGVILHYETKGPPQRVAITWSAFNEVITNVRAVAYVGDSERRQALTPGEPTFEWVREGAPKAPALMNVPPPAKRGWFSTSPEITEEEATAIHSALLRNVYRAFDYRRESDIYDALERSVAGEMLARLYLDIRRGLEIEAEGGPTTNVLAVETPPGKLIKTAEGGRAFSYEADWIVTGSVEHWGHIHTRKNRYSALFDISVVNDAWKIRSMNVRRQERLETKLVRRGVEESAP